jgi:hypothetical protein
MFGVSCFLVSKFVGAQKSRYKCICGVLVYLSLECLELGILLCSVVLDLLLGLRLGVLHALGAV